MRNVLRASSQHADSLRDAEIEPEHLVLGLLDEIDGGAGRAFRHFGVDTAETKRKLLGRIPDERS
jgi:ATP-dependent Clp protease ATP-binding subunit ClpA